MLSHIIYDQILMQLRQDKKLNLLVQSHQLRNEELKVEQLPVVLKWILKVTDSTCRRQ